MYVRAYKKADDEEKLMKLIEDQGEEWESYNAADVRAKYMAALESSITYVAYEGDVLCGYSRSLDDCGFYIYVCDLLVAPEYRGNNIGRKLMEYLYEDYPKHVVYVMSDVDMYYEKQGYKRVGSVFEVMIYKEDE
jgi:ribosomal protein S18 acetylase RimI-like enzyme